MAPHRVPHCSSSCRCSAPAVPSPAVHAGLPPGHGGDSVRGPLSAAALLDAVRGGSVPRDALVWAAHLKTPRPLTAVRQLRWLLASGAGAVKWSQIAALCLDALHALAAHAPAPEHTTAGVAAAPLVPTPRVVQRLAAPENLAPLATLLLTHDPVIMRDTCAPLARRARPLQSCCGQHEQRCSVLFFCVGASLNRTHDRPILYFKTCLLESLHKCTTCFPACRCALILAIAKAHAASLHRLYATGIFFFALAYVGRDLLPIGALLKARCCDQLTWSPGLREQGIFFFALAHLGHDLLAISALRKARVLLYDDRTCFSCVVDL
jgi:hypothetical protein